MLKAASRACKLSQAYDQALGMNDTQVNLEEYFRPNFI